MATEIEMVMVKTEPEIEETGEKVNLNCSFCIESPEFADISSLERHFEEVHKMKKKFCNICKNLFANEKQRRRHVKEMHGEGVRHFCQLCPKNFARKLKLKDHIEKFHPEHGELFCRFILIFHSLA